MVFGNSLSREYDHQTKSLERLGLRFYGFYRLVLMVKYCTMKTLDKINSTNDQVYLYTTSSQLAKYNTSGLMLYTRMHIHLDIHAES